MSDYSELKRLAEAALRNWPDSKLFERPECERFIDAARPDVVLALIAEVDGLHAQHGRDSGELRKLCAARDSARLQRDQLKAENAGLKTGYEAYERVNAELKADVEALRKDADRLDRLEIECEAYGTDIHEGNRWVVDGPFATVRDAIDAAMGQGEQS